MRPAGFALLSLVVLSGCASGPGLESRLAAYIGAPEDKLVQSLGVPDKQISVNGVQYLAYTVRHQAQLQPDFPVWGGWGGPYDGWGPYHSTFVISNGPQDIQEWYCQATFTIADGKVTGFGLKGNDCS